MKDITLMYLLRLAWRRIWALAIALVFFATAAFCYCKFFATPVYSATASIIVTNGSIVITSYNDISRDDSVSGTDISASLSLANTITDILKTPDIYKLLSERLNDDYNYNDLKGRASIARRNENTLFIDINFKSDSKEEAVLISNTFVDLSCEYITQYIPHCNALVASTAETSQSQQVYPSTMQTTAIAGIIGAIFAFIIVLLIDMSDLAIKGEEDFTSNYDIPLLGSVPDFETGSTIAYSGKGYYRSGY